MKGFYIEITNDLLSPTHRKRMGTAVWEFMWCLDKMTKIDGDVGYVLGGKPINLTDIAEDLGISINHISENLTKLENGGYITKKRTPYGIIISVNKAKKRFHQKVNSVSQKRIYDKVDSPSEKVDSPSEKVKSNIDKTVDNTIDNTERDNFPPNPRKEMEFFLNSKEYFDNVITHFTEKMDIPEEQVKLEVQKFQLYWTEPSKDGKKQRWEMQKTWDVKRRLLTWFSKQKEWNQSKVKKRKVTMTF